MKYLDNANIAKNQSGSFFLILLLLFIFSMVSCDTEKEEDTEPTKYLPELTLQSPDTTYFSIAQGETFIISVTASINAQSSTSLSTIQILHNYNNSGFETVLDSDISEYGYLYMLNNYTCTPSDYEGVEFWKIIVQDNVGGADSIIITTQVVNLNPLLNFKSGEYAPGKNRVNGDTTIIVGQEFGFGINAQTASLENLDRILIERKFENISNITVFDSSVNTASYTVDIITFAYPSVGAEEFIVTVWDKSNKSTTISFTITTTSQPSNITTYEDKILGAQNSMLGVSFATSNGTVYSLADANENSAEIDWVYFYGATNLATLAAPDDETAAMVYNNVQNGLQTWDIRNNTRFKLTTFSGADFNAINSSIQLITAGTIPTSPDLTKINNLAVGDVLAFETWDQKYGLIHINNIATGADGSIDITVKVQ